MKKVSGELKLLYSQYRELQSFAQFGSDLDEDTKSRLALGERIVEVLKQKQNSPVRISCQVAIIYAVVNGYLDGIPVNKVNDYEQKLFRRIEAEHTAWMERIENNYFEQSDIDELKDILAEMRRG